MQLVTVEEVRRKIGLLIRHCDAGWSSWSRGLLLSQPAGARPVVSVLKPVISDRHAGQDANQ